MSKLSFRARALDASKPMPIYLAEELPDLPEYSAINRAVPQMPSGMEKEEECEHHLQRAICTGLIIPTPEVYEVNDLEFYERCYPPDYKMPKQHIHMQPLWQEHEVPEYDIDSEDEKWLKQQRHPELTELKFEQMMDKLERSSGQTVVTLKEAKLLLERHDDLVIAVYDYWLNKRLKTQHPLILSVKTENRPGQSTNNPYLAFRRRTEKMQTRKNRKNDESSYEKMLKLRRDLARALSLLEMVARREKTKREMVRLTALLAERRYAAGDFANQMLPDPPPRPAVSAVHVSSPSFRREYATTHPHYPTREISALLDQPRQREKRPYKRRKHRHHALGAAHGLRDSGVYTSSEEESTSRTEPGEPPDDSPFAFRRKPGCYYEMPTSTLCGDPVDPESPSKEGMFQHEIDERYRFNLSSVRVPYWRCVGLARRRVGRGGRVLLDRTAPRAPPQPHQPRPQPQPALHTLLTQLPYTLHYPEHAAEEVELETKAHRNPKTLTRDYHTSGKYPWRRTFRKHLAKNPELWVDETQDAKTSDDFKLTSDDLNLTTDLKFTLDDLHLTPDIKLTPEDLKLNPDDLKLTPDDLKLTPDDLKPDETDEIKMEPMDIDKVHSDKSDISVSARTIDRMVKENITRVMRKRTWSGSSDSSYDSDESLYPVEKEFEKIMNEVNKKWLHFRPKTPPPQPPDDENRADDVFPLNVDTPITVELRTSLSDTFTTSEFSLSQIYPDLGSPTRDNDVSGEDFLNDNFTGLTEAQVESILSDTDLKALADVDIVKDDKKLPDDLLEELVKDVVDTKDSFLSHGQSSEGRANSGRRRKADVFGSTTVHISGADKEPIYVEKIEEKPIAPPPKKIETPKVKEVKIKETKVPSPVPTSKIIVEEVNEVPQIKVEKKKKADSMEEVQLSHGVQLKTVHALNSPVKKHIITTSHRRASDVTLVTSQDPQPQLVTVSVSDNLKVRVQNHLSASQSSSNVSNVSNVTSVTATSGAGYASPLAVAVPVHHTLTHHHPGVVTSMGGGGARRLSGVVVGAAGVGSAAGAAGSPPVVLQHAPNKLKVLHPAHLTHNQRAQLFGHRPAGLSQLPTVVSLATLGEAKSPNTAVLKAASGSVAQYFEIKGGQLGKGPHLVNVVRQPTPGKATLARLDLNEAKKRQVVATFDGTTLKGNIAAATRPHKVSVTLEGRQVVRATLPAVRSPNVRHQIQIKNRTLQVAPQQFRGEPSTSITLAPTKTATIPNSVVANLLHKNVQLPKGGQKIAISGPGGQALLANVQARLIAQPRPQPVAEIVEAAPVASSSTSGGHSGEPPRDDAPMEVT